MPAGENTGTQRIQCASGFTRGASAGMVSMESSAFATRGGWGEARACAISGKDRAR